MARVGPQRHKKKSLSHNSGKPNICHYIIFNKGYTRMSRINISLITTVSLNVSLQFESLKMSNGSHRAVLTTKQTTDVPSNTTQAYL